MSKLLLVEDDNNLREIYEARLQAEGYEIVSAKDGEEALVIAKAEKPDLVISDVMMPKISGFEMLDILRNTDELKGVKVIMLTALGQSDDQKRADKLGADRYLVKSQVTLEDIVRSAHELLGDQEGGEAAPEAAETQPQSQAQDQPATAAAPAPAPAPAPSPAPAPAPAPAPGADTSKDVAEPAAQEEADVEAKIENFVAGATSEPTPPAAPAASAQPAQQPAPAPAPAKTGGKSDDKASDDRLMADAVEQLVASTEQDGAKPSQPPQPSQPTSPTTIPVNVAPSDDAAAAPSDDSDDNAPGSKKIIKPLDSKPKKDIRDLLAEEEAKESQTVPGATIPSLKNDSASQEDRPAGAPMPPPSQADDDKPAGQSDPGSIAL
ncbi:MAG TPA: response regulator [Candidatus Saccharimonadales bacterium]|nr:response regulator [Candidatus Saccharimonadales bacterium]